MPAKNYKLYFRCLSNSCDCYFQQSSNNTTTVARKVWFCWDGFVLRFTPASWPYPSIIILDKDPPCHVNKPRSLNIMDVGFVVTTTSINLALLDCDLIFTFIYLSTFLFLHLIFVRTNLSCSFIHTAHPYFI